MRALLPLFIIIGLVLIALAVWFASSVISSGGSRAKRELADTKARLTAHQDLLAKIRETAWDNRDLDSALATIILDDIRSWERKTQGREVIG